VLGELDALFEAPADSRRTVVLMDDLHAHVAADTDAGPMLQDVVASGALVTATGHVGWLTTDPSPEHTTVLELIRRRPHL